MNYDKSILDLNKVPVGPGICRFEGSGWLIPFIDEINKKLAEYEHTAHAENSGNNSVFVLFKVDQIPLYTSEELKIIEDEFAIYFQKITAEILDKH